MTNVYTRKMARRQLKEWGVVQPFFVRFHWIGPGVLVISMVSVGLAIASAFYLFATPRNPSAFSLVGGFVAVAAVILGYNQWRMMRYEVSFDKFYERLNSVNAKLADWPEARKLMADEDGSSSLTESSNSRQKMYVFHELDNLEYIVEKYRLGLLPPELVMRAAHAFRHRCRWQRFRQMVNQTLQGRSDYSQAVVALVQSISLSHEHLPGSRSQYEQVSSGPASGATDTSFGAVAEPPAQ